MPALPLRARRAAATALVAALLGCADRPAPLVVESLPAPTDGDAAEPFVARAADGTLWMSWLERQPDSSVALRVSRLASGAWSAPRDVVRRKDLMVNWADFPSVVPLEDGTLLAHWLQRSGSGKYDYEIRLAESRDGGATWGRDTVPHAFAAGEHGFVSLLPAAGGGAGLAYLDGAASARAAADAQAAGGAEHAGAMQLGWATWKDGAVTGTRIVDERICDCCQTAAVRTARGAVVFYRDRSDDEVRDIHVVRLVDGTWTAPAPLHRDGWRIDFCPVNGPQADAIGDTVAVAWFTGAQDTARVQVAFSTDAGERFSAPVRTDDGLPTGRVDLTLLSGDAALVSWVERLGGDTAEVRVRLVRRDGTVEPFVTVSPSSGARASGFPRLARDGDGAVIAYTLPGRPSRVQVSRVRAGAR